MTKIYTSRNGAIEQIHHRILAPLVPFAIAPEVEQLFHEARFFLHPNLEFFEFLFPNFEIIQIEVLRV